FPHVEILSRKPDRTVIRSNFGAFYKRARQLAEALTKLGMQPGDRVASMMWNHVGHLETFFGVPCAGGILHTLNLRLHPHEIAAIAKHAADRFLIIDDVLLPLFEKFREAAPFEKVIVAPYCGERIPSEFIDYEDFLAGAPENFTYPKIEEIDGRALG